MTILTLNRFFTWSLFGHILILILLCLYMFFDVDVDNSPKSNVSVGVVYESPSSIVTASTPINTATNNNNGDIKISDNRPKAPPADKKTAQQKIIPVKQGNNHVLVQKTTDPTTILNDSKVSNIASAGYSEYIASIISIVKPDFIPDDIDMKTTMVVQITLKKNMELESIKVKKYSNNEIYNNNIMNNLHSISRFPQLPEGANFKDYEVLVFTFSPAQSDI
jgi:hypothetical protein